MTGTNFGSSSFLVRIKILTHICTNIFGMSLSIKEEQEASVSKKWWDDTNTRLMLSEFKKYFELWRKGKINKKKIMWQKIADCLNEKGITCTPEQVENRFKNLQRGYRRSYTGVNSGRRRPFIFKNELSELYMETLTTEIPNTFEKETFVESSDHCENEEQEIPEAANPVFDTLHYLSYYNMFRDAFKYYKSKQPPPNLSSVLKVTPENEHVEILDLQESERSHYNETVLGVVPSKEWKIYRIKNKPGLIFIKNPFTPNGQRYWISRCLRDFSKKPNKLNIDIHNLLNNEEHWWEVCNTDTIRTELLKKLRWSTLGYHHNWDTKIYSESLKDIFPEDLAFLCNHIANITGFKHFVAEAAIVNYYHMNSTLSGHTDHSEKNLDAPLISISLGQTAIFLIGGPTEDFPALPIFVESGDIIIMSKESRLCYHAVPKILPAFTKPWIECDNYNVTDNIDGDLYTKCQDELFWQPFNSYIGTARININVRQVLRPGQCSLNDE
ncbi:AlkB [Carabus blaptoides fortunei]